MADTDAARAREVAQSLPGAAVHASGHDLITASEVDAVAVTSWGPTHEEFVLAAIAVGKPVFCEKPLAPTPDACLRIIDAEVASGRKLVQIGFMRRYDTGYRVLKQALRDGRIGAPLLAHCAHRNPAVPDTFTSDMPLTDAAVHEMDIIRWLLDDEVTAVSVIQPRRTSNAASHLQDPQLLLMETSTGVHADVELFVNCRYGYDIRCELVGETGTVSLANPAAVTVRAAGTVTEPVPADWRERFSRAYDTELAEWVNSVQAGQAADGPSSWDGYAAAAVAEAALSALETGQRTRVALAGRPPFYA